MAMYLLSPVVKLRKTINGLFTLFISRWAYGKHGNLEPDPDPEPEPETEPEPEK